MKKIISFLLILVFCVSFSGCEFNTGKVIETDPFYSLQAAYNQGLITWKDLKNISKAYDKVDSIDEQLAKKIKNEYLSCYYPNENREVEIDKYFGTYSNCVALMIDCVGDVYTCAIWEETIGGVKFRYGDGQRIMIWKE